MSNADLEPVVLVVTALVLLYAAFVDLQSFQIRNELILALIGLWLGFAPKKQQTNSPSKW